MEQGKEEINELNLTQGNPLINEQTGNKDVNTFAVFQNLKSKALPKDDKKNVLKLSIGELAFSTGILHKKYNDKTFGELTERDIQTGLRGSFLERTFLVSEYKIVKIYMYGTVFKDRSQTELFKEMLQSTAEYYQIKASIDEKIQNDDMLWENVTLTDLEKQFLMKTSREEITKWSNFVQKPTMGDKDNKKWIYALYGDNYYSKMTRFMCSWCESRDEMIMVKYYCLKMREEKFVFPKEINLLLGVDYDLITETVTKYQSDENAEKSTLGSLERCSLSMRKKGLRDGFAIFPCKIKIDDFEFMESSITILSRGYSIFVNGLMSVNKDYVKDLPMVMYRVAMSRRDNFKYKSGNSERKVDFNDWVYYVFKDEGSEFINLNRCYKSFLFNLSKEQAKSMMEKVKGRCSYNFNNNLPFLFWYCSHMTSEKRIYDFLIEERFSGDKDSGMRANKTRKYYNQIISMYSKEKVESILTTTEIGKAFLAYMKIVGRRKYNNGEKIDYDRYDYINLESELEKERKGIVRKQLQTEQSRLASEDVKIYLEKQNKKSDNKKRSNFKVRSSDFYK